MSSYSKIKDTNSKLMDGEPISPKVYHIGKEDEYFGFKNFYTQYARFHMDKT